LTPSLRVAACSREHSRQQASVAGEACAREAGAGHFHLRESA
jgi:hypothetical protein